MIGPLHASLHSWIGANATVLRDHVIFSTIVLALLLAVSMLPFLSPRSRYALVLLGVAKFLVPAGVLSRFAVHALPDSALPALSIDAVFARSPHTSTQSELLCLFTAVWLAGTVALTLQAMATQRRWRKTIRNAGAASQRELEAMRSVASGSWRAMPRVLRSRAAIPLTAGFLRPVVLLPDCCADALDDDELRAVLAHEITHVERRHNLAAILQNAALALFWFNPALWIARRFLSSVAEMDCDERVLHFVPDPPTYLSGMLKVSYGFIAPQPAGVSCMSTLQLKERMNHLMKQQERPARSVPHRLALAIGVVAVALTTLLASAGEKSVPLRAGKNGVTLPKLVTRVEPVYPPAAREARLQGIVILKTVIDETGNVVEISVAKGIEGAEGKALEDAAAAAVKQWKFEPATKDGKPVTVTFKITVRFKLH